MRHPRKKKSNQRPKVVIEYPPVPTKKWIPPEKRKKPPKPEPAYVKPEGISQKLAISTLKKVWNKFELYGDAGIITGSFSQYHKRFNFKSNGFQGACNSAVACVYAYLYKMATWSRYLLDDILIRGDELYIRSTQQGDKCLIEVPPEQVHHSFFLGNQKITIFVSPNNKLTETVAQRKAIESLENFIEKFLSKHDSGIFYTDEKYTAIWLRDGVYYFFDPGEHDEYGDPWTGIPGFGVSFLGRFKKLSTLAEYLYRNFPSVKGTQSQVKFYVIPCGVARIVKIKTKPPETFDEVAPQDVGFTKIIEENIPPPPNVKQQSLFQYVHEEVKEPLTIQIQEISPGVHDDLPASKRPSFLHEGPINKSDICRYQVPVPTYLKGEQAKLSYYTELIPEQVGILRGSTCQTNPNFSKYLGRQSMGNALSALIMLRFTKAKHWVPRIVDGILQNGERIYRDAMLNIPRSHSLRLSNFPKKIEYENRKFTPEIDEYALVGQLQSQDYEILDLGPALDEFLTDNDCCIILGPQILAVWMEDGIYYMFDPNERDPHGRAIDKTPIVGSNVVNLEPPSGVACVLWFQNLNDLVNWYLSNTERDKKHDRFYLSKVMVNDYVEIPEKWSKFIGICLGKWILRGTFSQASVRFSPESRNSQGTANAFISLAMQTLLDVSEWSSDIVDEILTTGDGFYKLSVEQLQKKGAFTSPYLMLSELNPIAKLRDKEAHFELEECIVNGLVNAKNANDLSDVQKGLEVFFNENDYGILTTREISLSIWHKGEAYYYLDPYSRDEKGLAAVYGTSCVLRLLQLEDLARCIEGNLDPNTDDFFNITKLIVTLYDTSDGGVVKPFLNNYTSVNDRSAILRSWLSNENEKYEIRKGRQTVPMCLSGLSFNKLKPALEWTRNDMDIILDKGDDHYMQSIGKVQKELDEQGPPTKSPDVDTEHHLDPQAGGDAKPTPPPPPTVKSERQEGEADEEELNVITSEQEEEEEEEEEEQPEVELKITSENVIPEFKIGPNNIALEFVELAQGNIRESLKNSLAVFYEEEQTDENFNQEALLETENYTVAMWRDDKVYYVFDPKPRDKNGEVIGKEDWDPEPPMPKHEAEIDEDVDVEGGGDEGDETDEQLKLDEVPEPPVDDDEDEKAENEAEGKVGDALAPADLNIIEAEEEMEEEQKEQEEQEEQEGQEEQEEQVPSKPKKSPSYWLEQEKSGRACTRWFLNLNDMINFVYGNIPVRDRLKKDFVLKSVNAVNHLQTKHKFRPDDERDNVYSGDWYDFKELDYGVWIMRGTLNLTHELFPEKNRGKQTLTASVMALGIAVTFEMTCFSATVPDTIMVYGDKLYTFMKKHRKKQLLKDPNTNLKPDEIDWLVQHEEFHITDIPKKICVSKFLMEIDVEPNFVTGDVKAQNFEDILDVKRGLDKFFESNKYGVLFAKGLYVAVWKGERIYYMFDGLKRGPGGIQSTIGTGCITRFLDTKKLANIFLQNLPVPGKSEFVIHKVFVSRDLCPREREAKEVITPPKAVPPSVGLKVVVPGKRIISGTMSQEDPRFGKGPNVLSAPIAIIALTMSIVHKPETWSKPIVDEIVLLGLELYEDSVNELGFDFNPWEDKLDIYRVKKDFKIGVIKANCELRNTDQRGLIDVKDGNVQNLRQGMESFFNENTHGILVTDLLTLAVWEQQEEDNSVIYIFDPNPRSSTGMPLFTGTACVLSFANAKMASDHITGCILDPKKREEEYIIVPVEIVVGSTKTMQKEPKKSPTRSSISVLPRCSSMVAAEQKKKLRKLAEEERKRKEAKKQQMIGRNGYHLKGSQAILRGYKSQKSDAYSPESRDNQDIPHCIVSVVMNFLLPIEDWNYNHIDLILDTGDQLYIDSYIAYGPKNPKLGMENVLRKFFMGNLEVHITVYKPVITEVFTPSKLNTVLEAFFQQETVCILNYNNQWISLFFKGGYYFVFDPHERDIEGNIVKPDKAGTAVVIRFDNLKAMTLKVVHNLGGNTDDAETFSLWLISIETKQ